MESMLLTHADVGHRQTAAELQFKASALGVGDGAYLGARSIVLPGVSIGAKAVVAAGAVVTRPVRDGDRVCRRSCAADVGRDGSGVIGPLARGASWLALGQLLSQGYLSLVALVTAPALTPAGFGAVAIQLIVVSASLLLADGGFAAAIIREPAAQAQRSLATCHWERRSTGGAGNCGRLGRPSSRRFGERPAGDRTGACDSDDARGPVDARRGAWDRRRGVGPSPRRQ